MSFEYMAIIALVIAILIPGIYFIYDYSKGDSDVKYAQMSKFGRELLSTAEKVRSQGAGSWLTLDANLPEEVVQVNVTGEGRELLLVFRTFQGESSVVFFSDIELTNSTLTESSDGSIFADPSAPHAGKVRLRLYAERDGRVRIAEYLGAP